jgi:hypothetical protein
MVILIDHLGCLQEMGRVEVDPTHDREYMKLALLESGSRFP